MTDVNRVGRPDHTARYGVTSASGSSGNSAGDAFREHMGHSHKEEYRKHFNDLFDDLNALADTILTKIDISSFERYRGQLKELLQGAVKNAYVLSSEYVTDASGRQRVFETISVIDSKMDELAKDILNASSDKLAYLSRVDEIRGLVMDMLL